MGDDIQYAIKAGVIKMNIDTDTQWAFWDGVNAYQKKNVDYLQAQIGNPDGAEKPNKKYYDPRMALRAGEESMAVRGSWIFSLAVCSAAEPLEWCQAQPLARLLAGNPPANCRQVAGAISRGGGCECD